MTAALGLVKTFQVFSLSPAKTAIVWSSFQCHHPRIIRDKIDSVREECMARRCSFSSPELFVLNLRKIVARWSQIIFDVSS